MNKGKIILMIAVPGLLIIMASVVILFGAAASFKDSFMDFFRGHDETKNMTQEEYTAWLNDPENIYNALQSGNVDLSAVNFLMLDDSTVKQIFERIHKYNTKRSESKTVSYTYRVESYPKKETMETMDEFGTIPSDSGGKSWISYDNEASVEISRESVEKEGDEEDLDLFAVRWQPVLVACAMAVQQEYDDWGTKGGEDISDKTIEEANLKNYYLTDAEIDAIIDIFYYNATYYYDAISSSTTKYLFKRMVGTQCAYRLESSVNGKTRITKRIPCSAPLNISNKFISYDYQYDSSGKCTSRDYTMIPEHFFTEMNACIEGFDMQLYLTMLAELPAADDLYKFYNSENFQSLMIVNKTCTNPKICKSIGIYYNSNISDAGDKVDKDDNKGGFIEASGDTFGVPFYDYVADDRKLYVDRVEGQEYGLYQVKSIALKSGAQTDGVTAEQIEYALANCKYYASSGCILFDTAEHRAKTAEIMYEYQEDHNVSVFFILAIMRTEGAIKGSYGHDYYNYFNIKGTPSISDKGFKNYKAAYGDGFSCLREQLDFIVNKYINKGKANYFKMSWNGYDGKNWSSLSMCYCPAWDDYGMPWAAGSLRLVNGTWKSVSPGQGWVNNNASYRGQLESIVKDGYPDWNSNPFVLTEENADETFGSGLRGWLSNLFSKKDDGEES